MFVDEGTFHIGIQKMSKTQNFEIMSKNSNNGCFRKNDELTFDIVFNWNDMIYNPSQNKLIILFQTYYIISVSLNDFS